ncbi:MAG: alpha/beta fold hydrolase, partial [Pseudomonadota bacterium]
MNRAVYFGAAALVAAAVMLPVADRVATFAPGASMQQPAVGASDAGDADPAKPCFGPVTNGITIRCGRLQVPEDYAEPDGRAVTFGHMRLRPAVVDSSAPPLYFVDGGPGTGTTGAADFYPSFWLEWVKNVGLQRELILFDQRGVGASVPSLNCTELDEPVARANLSRDGRTFPGFAELSDAALKACRARLIAEGVAIDQYNSNNIIRDMERLRAHLGHDRIALIGVSNGTRIALKYLRQYSAVVDAVVLDSVAPPDVAISREYLFSFMTSFRRMAEVCQEQPTCAARYPDPVDLLARALQRLEEKPIDVAVENRRGGAPYVLRVDDLTLFDLLFDMAYGVSGYERMLSIIASIAEGREPELGSIATHFVHDG